MHDDERLDVDISRRIISYHLISYHIIKEHHVLAITGRTLVPEQREEVLMDVVMKKGHIGLGFCIEGGKGSILGDLPITVKRLFKGHWNYNSFNII